tara:strand:+ start:2454 stop:3323 length:870 start_codon:yes stop_codon:yes gene_type:complete
MNDNLCIILIVILFLYICYKHNPITEGLSDVEKVLDGSKSSCDQETNPSYTYTAHIKTPSKLHMGTKGNKVNKNLSGLGAYTDILTKGKSKATKKKKVLGGAYFAGSGVTCYDADCNAQTSTCYQNSIPADSSEQGLIPGLISDLNVLSGMDPSSGGTAPCTATNKDNEVPACTKVALNYASDNCLGYGAAYLLNSDINKLNKSQFYKKDTSVYKDALGNGFPNLAENYSDNTCSAEAFTSMNSDYDIDPALEYKTYYTGLHKNDPIKQAFILMVGLGGIYFLQSLLLK